MPRTVYHTSMLSLTIGALFVSDEKEFRKAGEAGPAAIQRDPDVIFAQREVVRILTAYV